MVSFSFSKLRISKLSLMSGFVVKVCCQGVINVSVFLVLSKTVVDAVNNSVVANSVIGGRIFFYSCPARFSFEIDCYVLILCFIQGESLG